MGNHQTLKYSLSPNEIMPKLFKADKREFLSGDLIVDWDQYYESFTLLQHWFLLSYHFTEERYQPISDYLILTQNYDLNKKSKKNAIYTLGDENLQLSNLNAFQILDKMKKNLSQKLKNGIYFGYELGIKNLTYIEKLIKSFRRCELRELRKKYLFNNNTISSNTIKFNHKNKKNHQKYQRTLTQINPTPTAPPFSISELKTNKDMPLKGDNSACVICLDQPRNTLVLPCKHNCLCQECSDELTKCPICRATNITFLTYINS